MAASGRRLPGEPPEAWRVGFAAGLWQAFANSSPGARHSFQSCFSRSHQDKSAIAQELLLAAFADNNSAIHHGRLDSLLETLPSEDRIELIQNLVVQSASGKASKERMQDYIGSTYHIPALSPADGLKLMALATLLLTNGQGPIPDQASQRIGEALASSSAGVEDPALSSLLSGVSQHIADLCEHHAHELEKQKESYEAQLERRRLEEEQMNQKVDGLRADIARNREESRLDVLKDTLTVLAETLRLSRRPYDRPDELRCQVEAGLVLAMKAGGAEEFGSKGELVYFNPARHEAMSEVPVATEVRTSEPGVLVRGRLTGTDHVLVRPA